MHICLYNLLVWIWFDFLFVANYWPSPYTIGILYNNVLFSNFMKFCYHAQSLCMWLMSSCTCWIAIPHVELQKHRQKNPNEMLTKKNSNQRVIHCQLNYVNDNFVCELHQINGNKFARLKFIWIHVIPCKCEFFVTHSPYYFLNKHGLCFFVNIRASILYYFE